MKKVGRVMLCNASQFNLCISENQGVTKKKPKKACFNYFLCWEYSARSQLIPGNIKKQSEAAKAC